MHLATIMKFEMLMDKTPQEMTKGLLDKKVPEMNKTTQEMTKGKMLLGKTAQEMDKTPQEMKTKFQMLLARLAQTTDMMIQRTEQHRQQRKE